MLVDTHAHLDMPDFEGDLKEVILRAERQGVEKIITIGIDVPSSRRAVEIALAHEGVFATVGIHPHNASGWKDSDIDELCELASCPKVVAWGEIGLDFNRNYSPPGDQLGLFEAQVRRSVDIQLPVVIHDREAHEKVIEILKKYPRSAGVVHCFSGDMDVARIFLDLGMFISIPGTVTYKKADTVREVAAGIPSDRILVETDAPYLTPVPYRGKRNEPSFVRLTALEIARLRGLEPEEFFKLTSLNAARLFRLA